MTFISFGITDFLGCMLIFSKENEFQAEVEFCLEEATVGQKGRELRVVVVAINIVNLL